MSPQQNQGMYRHGVRLRIIDLKKYILSRPVLLSIRPHGHVTLGLSWWLFNLFSHTLTAQRTCRTAIVLNSEVWIDYPTFVSMYYLLTSEWGCLYVWTICGSGVRCHRFGSSGFAEWCLGEVQSKEREWCHYEHFHCWDSMQPVSQDDIHPDKWSQPFSFQRANGFVAWTITLETGANKYPSSSSSLTYLRTLVIVVVTNLFANTRHHRRPS